MTRDDIIRMAREAGAEITTHINSSFGAEVALFYMDDLAQFFHAAYTAGAAAEREECAKLCDEAEKRKWLTVQNGGRLDGVGARDCAAAIRARGER